MSAGYQGSGTVRRWSWVLVSGDTGKHCRYRLDFIVDLISTELGKRVCRSIRVAAEIEHHERPEDVKYQEWRDLWSWWLS